VIAAPSTEAPAPTAATPNTTTFPATTSTVAPVPVNGGYPYGAFAHPTKKTVGEIIYRAPIYYDDEKIDPNHVPKARSLRGSTANTNPPPAWLSSYYTSRGLASFGSYRAAPTSAPAPVAAPVEARAPTNNTAAPASTAAPAGSAAPITSAYYGGSYRSGYPSYYPAPIYGGGAAAPIYGGAAAAPIYGGAAAAPIYGGAGAAPFNPLLKSHGSFRNGKYERVTDQ